MFVETWDQNIGWGAGSTMQTAASTALKSGVQTPAQNTLLQGLLSSMIASIPNYKFDLQDFIGNQGPQGPAGPRGLPGLPGIGTNYIPFTQFPSYSYTPAPRIQHFSSPKDSNPVVWDVLYVWSELATEQVFGSDGKARGWAKIVNDSGSDRIITLWMKLYRYDEYHIGDPDDWAAAGTLLGETSETIPAGKTATVNLDVTFTKPNNLLYYISLFGRLDNYDPLLSVAGNHYGISGVGIYPRT